MNINSTFDLVIFIGTSFVILGLIHTIFKPFMVKGDISFEKDYKKQGHNE